MASGSAYLHIYFTCTTIYIITILKKQTMTVLCGIRTCNELMVSEHDFSCNGYKHNILYFYHSLLPIIFLLLFLSSLYPHGQAWKVQDALSMWRGMCVCVNVCKWPTVPLLKDLYTIRVSPSDLPHLLSRQVVSTSVESSLFPFVFLSPSIGLSLVCFIHIHMRSHGCATIESAC